MNRTIFYGQNSIEVEINEYGLIKVKFNGTPTRWNYNPGQPFDIPLGDLVAMKAFDSIDGFNDRLNAIEKVRTAWQSINSKLSNNPKPEIMKHEGQKQKVGVWLSKHGY
ncbi:MAG: hypothetical protein JRN26_05555 [Nitrososphaerota archaeon]|jgi:hypothetical protein|nr:hypothetical protein [Nitrososphaerota archaeon]MDG6927191.1 hypothetical protein [Nitrososphaerota archaeon]MDG6930821.1 hypothetical protein [Nitrososphaerota archaeon]MDG6932265.1 hypothetical protein [Nitrososphaerota archaeon]MDG6936330.1 hypothetical protein [Nitrososphaerota archaeon]